MIASCSNTEEPTLEPEQAIRISSIVSDNESQEYSYDGDGRIKTWNYSYLSSYSSSDYAAEYNYPSAGIINIKAIETVLISHNQTDKRIFEESLHLSSEGTALYGEGTCSVIKDSALELRKKYRYEYKYDESKQLTSIEISEWVIDHEGNVLSKTPWTYENRLYWNNGNLEKYVDYLGSNNPYQTIEYTYWPNTTATYVPVVFPVIRSYYIPLQYNGIFGKRPAALVSQATTTWQDGATSTSKYSYTFGISALASWITAYSIETGNRPETEYTVTWTK